MEQNKIMTVGNWLVFMLIQCVPLVNIIYTICIAIQNVETAAKPSKVTFCRYLLIMYAILLVLCLLVFGLVLLGSLLGR